MRYRLGVEAVHDLARRTRTPLPWADARGSAAARALDTCDGTAARTIIDPAAELRTWGLLSTDDEVDASVVDALGRFAAPEILVDLVLGRPGVVLRSWHRLRDTRVVAVSRCGAAAELAWWDQREWPAELASLVRAPGSADAHGSRPAAHLRLPFELVLGSGAALRLGRPDLLAELARRHAADPVAAADQMRTLHGTARGRLRATVGTRRRPGRHPVGLLSWVLLPDGWHELVPDRHADEPMVVVRAVAPADLGDRVARLVAGVRA